MNIKSIDIDDFFKYSFVISIDDKRFKKFESLFNGAGFNYNFNIRGKDLRRWFKPYKLLYGKYIPDTRPDNYTRRFLHDFACSLSHTLAIKEAKDNNYPFVVIFEDDVIPCVNCKNLLQNALSILPNNWEVLKFEESARWVISIYDDLQPTDPNGYINYKSIYSHCVNNNKAAMPPHPRPYNAASGGGCYVINSSIYDHILRQYKQSTNFSILKTPIADIRIFQYNLFYNKLIFVQGVRTTEIKKIKSVKYKI